MPISRKVAIFIGSMTATGFFAGNYRNNACVASVLTLEEALTTIDLSLRFPHIFAEMFL
jgi:hypothetical protein